MPVKFLCKMCGYLGTQTHARSSSEKFFVTSNMCPHRTLIDRSPRVAL